jgi:hypothetical protein
MAPGKSTRNGHDDAKQDTPNTKDKDNHGSHGTHANGKLRRVASTSGPNHHRDGSNAGVVPAVASTSSTTANATANPQENATPGVSLLQNDSLFSCSPMPPS